MQSFFARRASGRTVAVFVLILVAAGVIFFQNAPKPAAAATNSTSILTVQGTAAQTVTPTTAVINLGSTVHAAKAQTAMAQTAAIMSKVIQTVEADGVAANDLQTGQLNLNPDYASGQPGHITGYEVTENLQVTVRSLNRVGTIIDDAVGAGANQLEGISFLPADPQQWEKTAYQQALADADAKAQALAADENDRVMGTISINTVTSGGAPVREFHSAVAAPASVPILAGQQTEQVVVTVKYRIGP